jgi:hypothetical protein
MAKKADKFDPDDGLIVGEVGPWAKEKYDRLRRYIDAARGARAKFLQPKGTAGASYIELYSGAGRSVIKDTTQFIEGSAVVAFNAGRASGYPFSEMHLSDLEARNSSALAKRIAAKPTIWIGKSDGFRFALPILRAMFDEDAILDQRQNIGGRESPHLDQGADRVRQGGCQAELRHQPDAVGHLALPRMRKIQEGKPANLFARQ